jgi:hypothetical protein
VVPFVLFDEFDSALGDEPLGWLKYFLAPMQDGVFRDGDAEYHVGKAVFVFAGGTRSSFERFADNVADGEISKEEAKGASVRFRDAKGPDFVSRLRGHIDILGPNRQRKPGDDDEAFVLRRAMVLRGMLRQNAKCRELFDSRGTLRMDEGVLRALLYVSSYAHGTRSMEAVIDMSRLAGKSRFDLSSLPHRDQLAMHVDPEEFLFLAQRERFHSLLRLRDLETRGQPWSWRSEESLMGDLARRIHEDFTRQRRRTGRVELSFDELPEDKKRSNRDAAEDIPTKLLAIGHGIRRIPEGYPARTPDIIDEEVEVLARMEHDRWCREQRMQGYVWGPKKDLARKVHPFLVRWEDLLDEVKDYDREAVRAIPVILRDLGFEIYRFQELEEIEDVQLVQQLARLFHDQYVSMRRQEGDSPGKKPALVAYDNLSPDLKEANLDAAASAPRKLRRLGYTLRRVQGGARPTLLVLSDAEILTLAKLEHARWWWQKIFQGWSYAPGPKDDVKKTSPYLVPWNKLDSKIQDRDIQQVKLIPGFLQKTGYDAERES